MQYPVPSAGLGWKVSDSRYEDMLRSPAKFFLVVGRGEEIAGTAVCLAARAGEPTSMGRNSLLKEGTLPTPKRYASAPVIGVPSFSVLPYLVRHVDPPE